MENRTNPILDVKNRFDEVFELHEEAIYFKNLHKLVKEQSFYKRYKDFKQTVLYISYLFSLFSMLSASYAVYFFFTWISGLVIVGYLAATAFLFFMEKVKRKSSNEFFRIYFFQEKKIATTWLSLSLLLLGASIASSCFGVGKGVEETAPDPELLRADSLIAVYDTKIANLQATNTDLIANKNKQGQTFYKLYPSIEQNTAMVADFEGKKAEEEKKLEGKNQLITKAYMAEVKIAKWTLVVVTLAMELLFELCMMYLWYYKHRSYIEWKTMLGGQHIIEKQQAQRTENSLVSASTDSTSNEQMEQLIQQFQKLQEDNQELRTKLTEFGSSGTSVENRSRIGFHKKKTMDNVYTATPKEIINDRYTIAHTYNKAGKVVTVRYTAAMVRSRIQDYKNKVAEAIELEMKPSTLQRRKDWLAYWEQQERVLRAKITGIKNQKT